MSANQDTETAIMFISRQGPSQFPSPLPLPLVPFPVGAPTSTNIQLYHVAMGLLSFTTNTATAPIERVHLLMQNQNEMIKSGCLSTPYKSMKDCFQRTIKQDGFFSLWRGNCVNLCKSLTSQALAFSIYKNAWHNLGDDKNNGFGKFEAAMCSATLLQYPLDYARTRLATDVKVSKRIYQFSLDSARKNHEIIIRTREFSGMFDVYRETLFMSGTTRLYTGYFLSFLGILALDFSHKKIAARHIAQENEGKVARSIPSIMMYSLPVVFYPVFSLSRRMMMNDGKATTGYKNTVHAFKEIVKHEGFSSLYKGVTVGAALCFARICAFQAFSNVALNSVISLFPRS